MTNRLWLILAPVLLLIAPVFGADLQHDLEQMAAAHGGKVALFAKNLKTGQIVAINADEPVQTASVIKLPIMVETFYEAKAGQLHLHDKLTLAKDNQVEGSGVLTQLQPGLQLTVEDAVTLMMIISDNTATNTLLDQVTIPAVNARLAALGLKNTYLYRKVFKPAVGPMPPDQKKFGLGKTTAREMAQVMESIQRCDLKDQALCERMISIMRRQQDQSMIPRYIETSEKGPVTYIADKVGQDDGVRNDVALIGTTSGPIIISIFTWDNQDQRWMPENRAEILIANMAKRIVDEWAPAAVR